MDKSLKDHLAKLRKRAKDERDRKNEAAAEANEAEYQAMLKTIENLGNLMEEEGMAGTNGNVGSAKAKDSLGPAAITRLAVAAFDEDFTVADLDAWVQRHHPDAGVGRPAISSAFSKMVENKIVEVVQEAKGRFGGVYRRCRPEPEKPNAEKPLVARVIRHPVKEHASR